MTGRRVLTLPSRISGNPVTRATGTTGTLALPRSAAVPPVETISKPRSASPRASSTIPSLRYTESRALLFIRRPPLLTSPTEGGGNALACLAPRLHRPPSLIFHRPPTLSLRYIGMQYTRSSRRQLRRLPTYRPTSGEGD